MAMTDLTIVSRSLRTRLFSTCTTVASVAVAVALMLVLLMLRTSGREAFERGTGNVHLLVSREASGLSSVLNGMFYAAPPLQAMTWAEYQSLVTGLPLEWSVPVQLGDSFKGRWPVLATSQEFFTKFQPAPGEAWALAAGRWASGDFEIVIGADAARGTGLRVGDSVVLTHGAASNRAGPAGHEHGAYAYQVVGVLKSSGTVHDRALFTNLESAWIIHAADRREREGGHDDHDDHDEHDGHDAHDDHHDEPKLTRADLTDADRKITSVYLRVLTRPGQDASAAVPMVMEHIRRDPALRASPLTVAGPVQEIRRLDAIVGNVNQVLVAMAVVVMASSGVGILLALYNSMEQRRRQVAILRVLGASQGRIFGLVMAESAILGLLGVGAGLGFGLAGAWLAAGEVQARLGLIIHPTVSPGVAGGLVLGTLALSMLAGLVPAILAYRTSVLRGLRPVG